MDKEGPTVWAAEHGASTPDIGRGEDAANVGHRWRIHGRLEDLLVDEGLADAAANQTVDGGGAQLQLDEGGIRSFIARETEIDVRDVEIQVDRGEITLRGTVADEGEILALVELLRRQPGVIAVHDRLLAQVA